MRDDDKALKVTLVVATAATAVLMYLGYVLGYVALALYILC
jgi:ABC-type sulfate transport system permease component